MTDTKCAKCDYDILEYYKRFGFDGPGLLGGYCPTCWPESPFAGGVERIEFSEPVTVNQGETAHDAIMRAVTDGKAKLVYRQSCDDSRCIMPKGHYGPHMGRLEMWPNTPPSE